MGQKTSLVTFSKIKNNNSGFKEVEDFRLLWLENINSNHRYMKVQI